MTKLLITIPFSANDAVACVTLLDHIHRIQGKTAIGHCLLVANPDCHAEMVEKIRVTAELAFQTVNLTTAPKLDLQFAADKFRQMNNLFRHAALTVMQQFRLPWLWLEPDCFPVYGSWQSLISSAYEEQPKKYMGLISNSNTGQKFMARVGVYFQGASYELDRLCQSEIPFPIATADEVVKRATPTNLIQYLNITTVEDLAKISGDAVVVHGDKSGIFAENWMSRPHLNAEYAEAVAEALTTPVVVPQIQDLNPMLKAEHIEEVKPRLTRRQLRELAAQPK